MQLNLPAYQFKTRKAKEGKMEIFDVFRKKFVALTAEEWVRQNFLKYLVDEKDYPKSLLLVEKGLSLNNMLKRFDAVAYDQTGKPMVLMEFKAPEVRISQKVFEQVAAYNLKLKVRYLIVSNGMVHYCCLMNYQNNSFTFIKEIPDFAKLSDSTGT
jgi:hypothetical protein